MIICMCGHIYNLHMICLQGSAVPRSPCSNAITNLYAATDDCSRAIQALLSGNGSALLDLYSGNCPTQFQEFVTPCSDVFGDEVNKMCLLKI